LIWRIRWTFNKKPWVLSLPNTLRIAVPRSGAGALIYYQGWSEPEVANFLNRFLQPGMCFIDIGAHIGEYVLLSAPIIGSKGKIYAFEPDPRNFCILELNVHLNRLQDIVVINNYAVDRQSGFVNLMLFKESSISRIFKEINFQGKKSKSIVKVPSISLNDYVKNKKIDKVDIIKIDVEGAELFVLEGASNLLSRSKDDAPILIFEYSPSNCQSLGYRAELILQLLREYGYSIFLLYPDGHIFKTDKVWVPLGKHINLVAAKSNEKILPLLAKT